MLCPFHVSTSSPVRAIGASVPLPVDAPVVICPTNRGRWDRKLTAFVTSLRRLEVRTGPLTHVAGDGTEGKGGNGIRHRPVMWRYQPNRFKPDN